MKSISFFILFGLSFCFGQTTEWLHSIESTDVMSGFVLLPISVNDTEIDEFGNLYIAGHCAGNTVFEHGVIDSTIVAPVDELNGFLAKYDPGGNLLWTYHLEGVLCQIGKIEIDKDGNYFIAGYFTDSMDLDAGPGVNMAYTDENATFLIKLDADRNYLWSRIYESPTSGVSIRWLESDSLGNPFFMIRNKDVLDFDPDLPITHPVDYDADRPSVLIKLDPDGDIIFLKAMGAGITDLVIDKEGYMIASGMYEMDRDFDPNPMSDVFLPDFGNGDIHITKYDGDANHIWTKTYGGPGIDDVNSISIDSSENIVICGEFEDSVDFDNSVSDAFLYANPDEGSGFVLKVDENGDYIWARGFHSTDKVDVRDIAINGQNQIFVIGDFEDTIDVNPNEPVFNVKGENNRDGFLSVLDSLGNFLWYKYYDYENYQLYRHINVDPFNNVYAFGDLVYGVDVVSPTDGDMWGLDLYYGIMIHKIGSCDTDYSTSDTTVCDFYGTDATGVAVYESQIINDAFVSSTGCDSIVEINLTVLQSTESYFTANTCFEYYWPPADETFTESGIYQVLLTNTVGCDSTINLDLNIKAEPNAIYQHPDFPGLFSEIEDADSYQWVACPEMDWIDGATNDFYYPPDNGFYALITERDGCTDTTECLSVVELSLEDIESSFVSIFPNPANEFVQIKVLSGNQNAVCQVYDLHGQLILSEEFSKETQLNVSSLSRGTYLVVILTEDLRIYKLLEINR